MRTHRKYQAFTNWCDRAVLDTVAQLRNLASVRLEPIVRGLRGGALADLVFAAEDRLAVLPFIEIAPEMLLQRESSPFVWPHDLGAALGEQRTEEIEHALLPWIESITLARQLNAEAIRIFGDDRARALFEAAREAGLLGAAGYAGVLKDAAPYLYATRFAQDGRAAVRDPGGAFGSVLLGRHAREVRADLGESSRNALARRWFDRDVFGSVDARASYDLAVCSSASDLDASVRVVLDGPAENGINVCVATPVPTDVMIAFDSSESPPCRTFSVLLARKPQLRATRVHAAPRAGGGSAGRILMLMREDYARVPDADTDEAAALASLLRAEGFTVDMAAGPAAVPAGYDLVHAFTLARVNELRAPLAAAHAANVPIVLTPFFQDVSAGGAWGTAITRAVLRTASDETELEDNLLLLAQRRLEAPGLSPKRQEPFAGYDQAVRTALQQAGAVIVSGAQEERHVRAFGYTGPVVASGPCLLTANDAEHAAAVRRGDFAFAHAPLESRSNLLPLVRAAVSSAMPLVIAGPVVEPEYLSALREQSDEHVVIAGEPEPAATQALYRSARVFADVSWITPGLHRTVRAAACGAALLVAKDGYGAGVLGTEAIWQADAASEASVRVALGDAWKLAREHPQAVEALAHRAGDYGDARSALVACVGAYAAAQQARSPA